LPDKIKDKKWLLRLMTGSSIALVESVLTSPVERLKVYLMTSTEKVTIKNFFVVH
jgi:hypothetical protein